ncbi:MAG: DinB family protein [Ignavibacteria bacterium]|nr:DinB family protein [Ignavibacteria bacterium]MBK6419795.1 DinB family protein [Ignavibacteria bacterium]MBK6759574.1 DinB family protein [Ignavibacteria bacterium]MBK7413268.1 DinB family protein [Ignavibacteria bacterium]MBK7576763.1 DinB family protein [Ignavibacteria bacterium]
MLQRYLTYNLWANTRLIENIAAVPASSIDGLPLAPFGSIHEALRHIVGAENIWLERMKGQSPTDFLGFTEGKTLDELLGMLRVGSQRWVEYVTDRARDAEWMSPEATMTYTTTKGVVFVQAIPDVVLHVVNHSTYHRGQIMSALRSVYDGRLLGLDMFVFARG